MDYKKIVTFEEKIGYHFTDCDKLVNALSHSSYANERHKDKTSCNERLEFLGDAVLELVSSEFLFERNKEMQEGDMTKLRASLVCEQSLAKCAKKLKLGDYLLLGKGEDATGGRERNSILSDALEAVIGAIYLDGGFASAKEFVHEFILTDIERKQLFFDSKTILQEMVQGRDMDGSNIQYELVRETGPDHDKEFQVQVRIHKNIYGMGVGHTKKAAEQEAAYQAILKMREKTCI